MGEFVTNLFWFLFSGAGVGAAIVYFGRTFFEKYLDKKFETFKHELAVDLKTREQILKSQIEFKERQLREFYFPIYARLKRGRTLYELWDQGKLDQVEPDILALFVQSNESNVNTILNQSELIDGNELPESYIHYLIHVAAWDPFLKKETPEIPKYREEGFKEGMYPQAFEEAIFLTTEKLKQEISELYKEYGYRE